MTTETKRYAIYFRETVVQRCHVNVHGCSDLKTAIETARLRYAQGDTDGRHEIEIESSNAEIDIFGADEYDNDTGRRLRSWELDDISGQPGEPIDIEP
jgi:hypothetical protein